jgi:hypothetical protein
MFNEKKINLPPLAIILFFTACSVNTKGLLRIKEQGSFAIGGTVIKNEGIFDPIKRTPEGQTFHGMLPTKSQLKLENCLWYFGMASGSFPKHGKLRPMDGKVLTTYF